MRIFQQAAGFLLIAGMLNGSLAAAQEEDRDVRAEHGEALRGMAKILAEEHFAKHPVDDEISRRWFGLFLEELDPRRHFFTAEDVRRFTEYREKLDDHALRGNLTFAELVRDTYAARLEEATAVGQELLRAEHDFSLEEAYEFHPKEFCENAATLRERWRLRVKFDLLLERGGGFEGEEAIAKLAARYERIARDNRLEEDEELYERYLDAFVRAFDPRNAYIGPRSLVQFNQ